MRSILLSICLLSVAELSAQTDSLKKWSFAALHVEIQLVGGPVERGANQQKLRQFVKNDDLLNRDLSGYNNGGGYYCSSSFPAIVSAKAYFNFAKRKKVSVQTYIGLGYGLQELSAFSYSKVSRDTTGTYVNSVNGNTLFTVNEYLSSYFYTITSKRIVMPFGINVSSDRQKRVSFSFGLELAPGISFDYKYLGQYTLSKNELTLDQNSSYSRINSYSRNNRSDIESKRSSQKIKGIGFSGYVSVPLAVNIRVSKRIKILDRMLLSGSISPAYYLSTNKVTGNTSSFLFMSSAGIRYNFI